MNRGKNTANPDGFASILTKGQRKSTYKKRVQIICATLTFSSLFSDACCREIPIEA